MPSAGKGAKREIRLGPESLKDPVVQELHRDRLPVNRANYLQYRWPKGTTGPGDRVAVAAGATEELGRGEFVGDSPTRAEAAAKFDAIRKDYGARYPERNRFQERPGAYNVGRPPIEAPVTKTPRALASRNGRLPKVFPWS